MVKRVGSLVGLVVVALFASSPSVRSQSSEEYKVYDAVVRYMFRDGVTQFDMNAKVDQIVIRDRTFSQYARAPEKEDWEQVKIRLRTLSDETIAGYESARKTESDLKSELDIPLKYLLVNDKKLRKVFNSPTENLRTMEQWEEFYEIYPKSAGFNSFSRVGFDKAKRNALVYFINWCGSLCGTGSYVHLEKRDDGWVVTGAGMMWIS